MLVQIADRDKVTDYDYGMDERRMEWIADYVLTESRKQKPEQTPPCHSLFPFLRHFFRSVLLEFFLRFSIIICTEFGVSMKRTAGAILQNIQSTK